MIRRCSPPFCLNVTNDFLLTWSPRWPRADAPLPEYRSDDRLRRPGRHRLVFHLGQCEAQICPHLELTETQQGAVICVNTLRANSLAKEAISAGIIPELSGYNQLKSEVKYGEENSRIDIMLQADDRQNCYIEVKSVTLAEKEYGYFPDAVTTRGQKHLRELMAVAANGDRAVILFAVLHSAIDRFSPAHHIDARYAQLLTEAQDKGGNSRLESGTFYDEDDSE